MARFDERRAWQRRQDRPLSARARRRAGEQVPPKVAPSSDLLSAFDLWAQSELVAMPRHVPRRTVWDDLLDDLAELTRPRAVLHGLYIDVCEVFMRRGWGPDRSGTYYRFLTPKERYATFDRTRRLCLRWLAQPAELRDVAAVLVEDGMPVADAMRAAELLL